VVLTDVPAMRELSPYRDVHAPHVVGYFNSKHTSFELVPRSDGGTDIIERTSHELKLEPVRYEPITLTADVPRSWRGRFAYLLRGDGA